MIQNYQDAMAICAWAGPPDLFITFTCNPNWKEIQEFLIIAGGQSASDRLDIVARVFHLKLIQLLDDLIKRRFFGRVVADLSVVEFQKRGLPHCHILITLEKSRKIRLPRDIDNVIRAEIPDNEKEPLLYELVIAHMIHGPCGAHNPKCACMKNEKCSKKFPKTFNDHTIFDEKGYAIYRRRNLNSKVVDGKEIDNSWVVPYNSNLLLKYQCHINVEICNHRRAIKYLFKYVNKGPDFATAVIHQDGVKKYDEIKQYLDSRYIAASEASWRLFEFNLNHRHPAVDRLQYHLPGEQMVFFREDGNVQEIIETDRANKTMLTEWFAANIDLPIAKKYTYIEFPTYFVWDKRNLFWKRRKRGVAIGRLPYAHPAAGERYYLRMLLTVVKGSVSFEDIRTIDGVEHETYKAACIALGLLDDDNEWHLALKEASNWATANQLRRMFCTMLLFNEVTNPRELWNSYWKDMSDDYERRLEKLYPDLSIVLTDEQLKDYALRDVDIVLSYNNKSLRDFPNMPLPSTNSLPSNNRLIFEEQNYNRFELSKEADKLEHGLNDDQRKVFNAIISSCEKNMGELFFIYGGGGTGKTYLWNAVLAKLRSQMKIVLAVASSGIASLLLPGGRTAHSRFKIPIDVHEFSSCSISRKSNLASLIKETALIIWDEAPMMNRFAFDAVDRTFKDILSDNNVDLDNKTFGGKTVVLGGDFRQILPVIRKGRRQQIVSATLHKSYLWDRCKLFVLKNNMRVHVDATSKEDGQEFANWLINIGNGDVKGINVGDDCDGNWIEIPTAMLADPNLGIDGLINDIYTDLELYYNDPHYLKIRAILACRNEEVDEINKHVISQIKEDSRIYLSADTKIPLADDSKCNDFLHTTEFLNSLVCSGLPPHSLELKINTPIMLLRNLDPSIGLCNGTRLMIKKLGERVIKAEIITGTNIGKCVAIPRIIMSSDREDLPFILKRRQFPVRVAYAMTINKSQGQTLGKVGLYLRTSVFCHGQLYVAFSRATSASALKVLLEEQIDVPKNYTKNVVYKEVLQSVAEKDATNDDDIPLKDLVSSKLTSGKCINDCLEDFDENKNEEFGDPGNEFNEQCEADDSDENNDDDYDDDTATDDDDDVSSKENKEDCIPKRKRSLSHCERKFKYTSTTKRGKEINDSSTIREIADSLIIDNITMSGEKKQKYSSQSERGKKAVSPYAPLKKDKKNVDEQKVDTRFKFEGKKEKKVPFSSSIDIHETCSERKRKRLFMPSDITIFRDISERGTLYNIKVRITRLWYGMLYPKTSSPSFTFVARDEEGVEREVITDNVDAHRWKKMIFVDKIYVVKNVIKLITTRPIKVVNFTWQLSMTKQSVVHEVSDLGISAGPTYKFEKLNNVATLARRIEYVHDILAYVVEVGHARTFSMKRGGTCRLVDVFLIDDSCYEQPVKLTIWEDVFNKYKGWFGKGNVDGFLIIAIGMRAKIFQEKAQLETTRFTKIKFEVNGVPQAEQLMRWIRLKLSTKQLSYPHEGASSSNSNPNQIVKTCTIADLISETQSYPPIDKVLIFIVYATVTDIYADSPWFDVCAQCVRAVRVHSGKDYTCLKCGHTGSDSNKKFKVKARIEDSTDQTDIVAFDQQAETLLHRPLADIISLYTSSGDTYEYERHLDKCASIAYKIKLKVTRDNHRFIQGGGGFTVYNLERIVRQFYKDPTLELSPTEKRVSSNLPNSDDGENNFDDED